MKTRFNTYDIVCCITELQPLVGMRVNNIYDIDNKTYLIRLQRGEEKSVLLLESGNRLHTTGFEWPKNVAPSGFSMKMRKHLKNKRLEHIVQLGSDRVVDIRFGSGEAAYHVILELYDRGNVILTDCDLVILYVLRPHTEGDRFKFAVKEKYPTDRVRDSGPPNLEQLQTLIRNAKEGEQLKKVLMPHLEYGPSLLDHVLAETDIKRSAKIGKDFKSDEDVKKLLDAVNLAQEIMDRAKISSTQGFIIQKKEERPHAESMSETEYFYSNLEFHPMLYVQHENSPHKQFDSFNRAVDEYYSTLEGQKIELRALQQEREALKKLENVKRDHTKRLEDLEKTQESDKQKAELITRNQQLVESAILAVQTALANQVSWSDIEALVKDAASKGDPVAKHIKQLKLETNYISLYLSDPYEDENSDLPPMTVNIDLDLSAFANARRYYDQKRTAAKKHQKTIESQSKAFKSAEKKTKQTLKEVQTITNIHKARKVYWFEKFFWFISSENYLVIAGRDQQQNELIVKRYMGPSDIYVHADIHGASSVVIKNPSGLPVPPKTLNEAGTMAICYSVAWEAKVVTNAYWVLGDQVSKTAPTGEYLTSGSFMIRGKKNFLPPSHLILGLSFLFRLEDGSIERHIGERKVTTNDDGRSITESEQSRDEVEVEVEILDEEENSENQEEPEREGINNGGSSDVEEELKFPEIGMKIQRHFADTKVNSLTELERSQDIKNDGSSDGDVEEVKAAKFPDTHIKIQRHFEGTKVNILTEPAITNDDDSTTEPRKVRTRGNSENSIKSQKHAANLATRKEDSKQQQQQMKRGQRSKTKKIKEKYKDQDEEERQMRMDILQSAGTGKDAKKNKKGKQVQNKNEPKIRTVNPFPSKQQQKTKPDNQDEPEDDDPGVQADVDMIDALTGIPLSEDELLFAVPVVAPYNTLANYKFKVKLTPGTSRRGKAAKTAVNMFLMDRSITVREKDLLKAVKDEQLARNIPGKVKLSAPRLQALRR